MTDSAGMDEPQSRKLPSSPPSGDHAPKRSGAAVAAVYGAGVIQGIALVTFPAAGSILTAPHPYGLSGTQYGTLFVPQAAFAILCSFLGPLLVRKIGAKAVFLIGLACDLLSMLLLIGSRSLCGDHAAAFGTLLAATSLLGVAFGLTVPVLNTCAADFFPKAADRALLILNTLLGLGTALAPLLIALFVGLGFWIGLPVTVALMSAALFVFTLPLALEVGGHPQPTPHASAVGKTRSLPGIYPAFAGAAFLYGLCETMNGNWSSLYLSHTLGHPAALGSLALALFWAAVTGGRLLFASIDRWLPPRHVLAILPFGIAFAFLLTSLVAPRSGSGGVVCFALAGVACSAMLPLIISLGQRGMPVIGPSVAGAMIAFYQLGYGCAAFGAGPVEQLAGISLGTLFAWSSLPALALGGLSLYLSRRAGT